MRTAFTLVVVFSLGIVVGGQRKPQIRIPNGFGGDICWQMLSESCILENAQSRAKEMGVTKWRNQIVIPYGFTGDVCWDEFTGENDCLLEDAVLRRNALFANILKNRK